MIITDQGVAAAGLIALVNKALAGTGIPGDVLYDRVSPDSSPQVVDQARGLFRENRCDPIICKLRNPVSDANSIEAIKLISKYLPAVFKNGDDRKARYYLAIAACLAGAAFSNAGVGLIHALGHALGGVCQVPHGIAMNVLLPYGLEHNLPAVGEIIGELLLPLAGPGTYREYNNMVSIKIECDNGCKLEMSKGSFIYFGIK